jgi:chromosome segregation ATPase
LEKKQLESSTPNQNFYEEIIQNAGNKIEELTENVTALKNEISRLEEEKLEIKGKLTETIAQVVNLNDFNTKLMAESNELKQKIKSNEKKLTEIDDSHKVQIINLEKNNMKSSCDLTRSEDEIKKLKAEFDKLSKTDHLKLAKAESDLYNLNKLFTNAIIEKNAKQVALNEMNAKNEKLQTTFNLLEAERRSVNR